MGRPLIDMLGKKFTRLTVIEHDHVDDKNHHYWKCRCDCGNVIVVDGSKLRSGDTKSCGCYRADRGRLMLTGNKYGVGNTTARKDETGKVYCEWTVIAFDHYNGKHTWWKCRCSCGVERSVRIDQLRNGDSRSCGHLHRQLAHDLLFKDMTGKRFADIEVVGLDHIVSKTQNEAYWKCKCLRKRIDGSICGNIFVCRGSSIRSGKTKTCPACAYNTHGYSTHPLYGVYYGMLKRCHDPSCKAYKDYGGRGITVYPEWDSWDIPTEEVHRLGNPWFMRFMHWALYECDEPWEPGLEIDRRENDDGYNPTNAHFIPSDDNNRNKRNTRYINDGEEILVWSMFETKYDLKAGYVSSHVNHGWTLSEIVFAVKHPDLGMNRRNTSNGCKTLRDKDGFIHMIPHITQLDAGGKRTRNKEHT